MNILVGNNTLSNLGGSETYVYTFILELKKRGYNVEAFSGTDLGLVANKLEKQGITCNLVPSKKEYDIIILLNNNPYWKKIGLKKLKTYLKAKDKNYIFD